MQIRLAEPADAAGMSTVLREIIDSTGRERPWDAGFVLSHYIAAPTGILCSVAVDDAGTVLGFQSLIRAVEGNRYGVPAGWGIIGTHVSPRAHRQGCGAALFAASRRAAFLAGLRQIDACIQAGNLKALRFYDSLGFRTYREAGGAIHKVFEPAPGAG